MVKDIILTGLRANEELTLGNYLGAVLPMVDLQKRFAGRNQINMFVPDLHSFTTPINHDVLFDSAIRNLKYYMAAGLDIDDADTYIYRQSYIPAHSELTIILNNFTYFGEMARMTQFKEKSAGEDNVSVGLFDYPVLMAADILLYGARWVPVGEDQTQHLEITRDIGLRMNHKFGDLFAVPEETAKQIEFMGLGSGVRIRSLSEPTRKMSKSVADPRGTILLSDNPAAAAKKVMSATTDSLAHIDFDFQKQPGISNLLQILALLSGQDQTTVNEKWRGQTTYGGLKQAVADAVRDFLTDFQTKYQAVDDAMLLKKLTDDEAAMNQVANQTLQRVQTAVGLRPR
jgi:tryptophanyl-tRNA synthetase